MKQKSNEGRRLPIHWLHLQILPTYTPTYLFTYVLIAKKSSRKIFQSTSTRYSGCFKGLKSLIDHHSYLDYRTQYFTVQGNLHRMRRGSSMYTVYYTCHLSKVVYIRFRNVSLSVYSVLRPLDVDLWIVNFLLYFIGPLFAVVVSVSRVFTFLRLLRLRNLKPQI